MAQYLKINYQNKSIVLNADTILAVIQSDEETELAQIITTETAFSDANQQQYCFWRVETGSGAQAQALIKVINQALTSNPGGRVVEVSPSSDYTIVDVEYTEDN